LNEGPVAQIHQGLLDFLHRVHHEGAVLRHRLADGATLQQQQLGAVGPGDQLDRAANRLSLALVIAALIIGSSIVMTVQAGPTLFGLPAFGFLGFSGAVLGGVWLIRSIWRSTHQRDDED